MVEGDAGGNRNIGTRFVNLGRIATYAETCSLTDEHAPERIAIVIMVEPGFLEYQAYFLCLSLLRHLKSPFRIYPYCRQDRIEHLQFETKRFLDAATAGVRGISPAFNGEYPNGNKIYAMAQERSESGTLFLDTDMVALRDFELTALRKVSTVCGVQGRVGTWSNAAEDWARVYAAAGLPGPVAFYPMASDVLAHPYLNAGFVFSTNPDFPKVWLDLALKVDFDTGIENKRPWLDQVTLPVAITASRSAIGFTATEWNHSWRREMADRREGIILHYHTPMRIMEYGFEDVLDALSEHFEGRRFETVLEEFEKLDVPVFKPGLQERLRGRKGGAKKWIGDLFRTS